jgi:hypothetical protein
MIGRLSHQAAGSLAALIIVTVATVSCGQAILSSPDGTTLQIFVNPPFIGANGDKAVVSVLATEKAGTPVPDGTVIQFFTTLGKIDEQAKTNDGVARVNLISDARSGTAVVTAVSGPVTVKADNIVIGAPRVSLVKTQALDPVIDLRQGKSTASIRATVLDDKGNPIQGIIVRFSVSNNVATDRILDATDVPTNNSGFADTRVQTSRTTAGTITIKVEVLAPYSGSAIPDITIQVIAG